MFDQSISVLISVFFWIGALVAIVGLGCGTLAAQVESPASLSGLSESQHADVVDDLPLDLEHEILIRLLYRVAKLSQRSFQTFSEYTREVDLTDAIEMPREYRFWVFDVSGVVVGLQQLAMASGDSDDSLKFCFAVDICLDGREVVRVLARSVPNAWLAANPLQQPVRCYGLFFGNVKIEDSSDGVATRGLFVTDRVSWRPAHENKELRIGPSQVLLAQHGVDIGLLDVVRKQNTKPLGVEDRECFFQFLAASRTISEVELPEQHVRFVDLMQNPKTSFADYVVVEGRVRRCVPVQIEDPRIRAILKSDNYFELDLFIPLGDQEVSVINGPGESLNYRHRFPVTVCIAELPEGMTASDIENKLVEAPGFFYRFWRYRSAFTDESGGQGGQVSPLIIGLAPNILSPPTSFLDRFLFLCLLSLIGGVVVLLWFFGSPMGPSRFRKSLPESVDFSNVDSD